jgi:hypothetical protein
MSDTKVVEKIKTHFMFNKYFLENWAVCEKMWKNIAKPGRPQKIIKYGACALHVGT